MEPSNRTRMLELFELLNRSEQRLEMLINSRKPLLFNSANSHNDKLIKITLETILIASSQRNTHYRPLSLAQWQIIKSSAKERRDLLTSLRAYLSQDNPDISIIEKAISEARADVLESKIAIHRITGK